MNELLEKSKRVEMGMTEEQVKQILLEPDRFSHRRKQEDTGEVISLVWLTWRYIADDIGIAVDVGFKNGIVVAVNTYNFELPPESVEATLEVTEDVREAFIKP